MEKKLFLDMVDLICDSFPAGCEGCPLKNTWKNNGCSSCEHFLEHYQNDAERVLATWIGGADFAKTLGEPEQAKTPETRREILEESARLICGDREKDYGDAADNFRTVGLLWSAYLLASHPVLADAFSETSVTAADVAAMLGLLKLARAAANPAHMDNWVDLAGYAALGGEISKKEAE